MKRNRFHSICPYYAVFPEDYARRMILAYSSPGEVVFDPFAGRGTAVFEGLLNGREAAGTDTNPVAACISNAKCNPPERRDVFQRLRHLENELEPIIKDALFDDEFFQYCFHSDTLAQLLVLREALDWRGNQTDQFIAAVILGCLHGESHRSQNCLSNRMPRMVATKPKYSIRWWKERGLEAPKRDTFAVVREMVGYRFASPRPQVRGIVKELDVRRAAIEFPNLRSRVALLLTSPPYLDTTDYQEDQWLRLWFLGGPPRPIYRTSDDRHCGAENYWRFLTEAWEGIKDLLGSDWTIVVRIGGSRLTKQELREGLVDSLQSGLGAQVRILDNGHSSQIGPGQTRVLNPNSKGNGVEHDFRFVGG